ncbi:hypothetical protein SGPA1_70099 [Streptomyces misionensis JCM 4497]
MDEDQGDGVGVRRLAFDGASALQDSGIGGDPYGDVAVSVPRGGLCLAVSIAVNSAMTFWSPGWRGPVP